MIFGILVLADEQTIILPGRPENVGTECFDRRHRELYVCIQANCVEDAGDTAILRHQELCRETPL